MAHLNMIKMVNFMLCELYLSKRKTMKVKKKKETNEGDQLVNTELFTSRSHTKVNTKGYFFQA